MYYRRKASSENQLSLRTGQDDNDEDEKIMRDVKEGAKNLVRRNKRRPGRSSFLIVCFLSCVGVIIIAYATFPQPIELYNDLGHLGTAISVAQSNSVNNLFKNIKPPIASNIDERPSNALDIAGKNDIISTERDNKLSSLSDSVVGNNIFSEQDGKPSILLDSEAASNINDQGDKPPILLDVTVDNSSTFTGKDDKASTATFTTAGNNITSITPDLSIILLTYNNSELLSLLLSSIVKQEVEFGFELIIADNGCYDQTREKIKSALETRALSFSWKLLSLCDNPGFSEGNNRALKYTNKDSKWILFLNDDVRLMKGFLQHMFSLGKQEPDIGGVGCKLLNGDGTKMIEAGSIIWRDGSCLGYGRGTMDVNGHQFSYVKPVDYVSATCLMVPKTIFLEYGGFDGETFPAYYEDTDFQMHINHDLKKKIWYQPLAVAYHAEHASFGISNSDKLMKDGAKVFKNKWKDALQEHLPSPTSLREGGKILRASHGPWRNATNILSMDWSIPDKSLGKGFGRAFDNLKILSELGYFVTSLSIASNEHMCESQCLNDLQQYAIEVAQVHNCERVKYFLNGRKGFYQVIIVSRAVVLARCEKILREHCGRHNCAIVYDTEAMTFHRDELFIEVAKKGLVSEESRANMATTQLEINKTRSEELRLARIGDAVIVVSLAEKEVLNAIAPELKDNVHVIGHTMEVNVPTLTSFDDRRGILFLASYNNGMYYNGDAIWYFIKHIYPLVLRDATEAIPVVIAGKDIPLELKHVVEVCEEQNSRASITILNSPEDVRPLYEKARVFIVPHLYGAGIQYKLSESLAAGVPTVVSRFSADGMGVTSDTTCIGDSAIIFANCILSIHGDKKQWEVIRKGGLEYIDTTHKRQIVASTWQNLILNMTNR